MNCFMINLLYFCISISSSFFPNTKKHSIRSDGSECFCKLFGSVDDCECSIEIIDDFNNYEIYPRINSILGKNYFKYWKVNLQKECPFWHDDSQCALRSCHVSNCDPSELPQGFSKYSENLSFGIEEISKSLSADDDCNETDDKLGFLNRTISDESKKAFKSWRKYDDAQNNFCFFDDENDVNATYVDLLLNPERYTGYAGESPHRIWKSIYHENCFRLGNRSSNPYLSKNLDTGLQEMCLEKRAFYRMISGLHASINIHLCAHYFHGDSKHILSGIQEWGPNLDEFIRRFSPKTSNNLGPSWLKNVYFSYLAQLRALHKISGYLEKENFYTGVHQDDIELKELVNNLLSVIKSFPNHFNESLLFSGNKHEAKQLKEDFKTHFRNISRIMDCVGCSKCKLWGKLQTTGMGTALKILFSENKLYNSKYPTNKNYFHLKRQEIVALFNSFGRLSLSIHEIEHFRSMMQPHSHSGL